MSVTAIQSGRPPFSKTPGGFVELVLEDHPNFGDLTNRPTRGWRDKHSRWVAQEFKRPPFPRAIPGAIYLGLSYFNNRKSTGGREILATWSLIQAIKEHLYPGCEAVEIYPPGEELVNAAPMRWLAVFQDEESRLTVRASLVGVGE